MKKIQHLIVSSLISLYFGCGNLNDTANLNGSNEIVKTTDQDPTGGNVCTSPNIHCVPSEFATMEDAYAVLNPGQVILIAPGSYHDTYNGAVFNYTLTGESRIWKTTSAAAASSKALAPSLCSPASTLCAPVEQILLNALAILSSALSGVNTVLVAPGTYNDFFGQYGTNFSLDGMATVTRGTAAPSGISADGSRSSEN